MTKKISHFKTFIKWLSILITFFSIVSAVFAYVLFSRLSSELPDINVLRNVQYQTPLNIYSKDGLLIAQFGDKKRTPISLEEAPQQLINAFLAAEDSRFYEHKGVDYKGIFRASLQLILSGKKKQGGSTITMQVTRNFLLSREKTFTRKIKEIILALKIEKEFSKKEILELYLNKIYLGHHAYGIAAASQIYYGKPLANLNLAQLAMIAGLPKAPSQYNPITNPDKAQVRRDYVLGRMLDLDYITQEDFAAAESTSTSAELNSQNIELSAPFIAEMVRSFIIEEYGEEAYNSGLKVYTTIDPHNQKAAIRAFNMALHEYDERHGYRSDSHPSLEQGDAFEDFKQVGDTLPALVENIDDKSVTVKLQNRLLITLPWHNIQWARKFNSRNKVGPPLNSASQLFSKGDIIRIRQLQDNTWRLAQIPEVEGAFVALDPVNGAVLALSGGFDFKHSKYNRAIHSNRQPGSGFKPIIYTTALENGFTAASVVNDAPVVIDDQSQESEWRPENYSRKFFGPTSLRTALRKSRNLISIRLLRTVGIPKVTATALRFGFSPEQLPKSLTLALGSGQASPLQMARLYSVFANGGFLITPYFIDRIESNTGEILFQAEPDIACPSCDDEQNLASGYAPRIISPQVNFVMNSLLQDVVKRGTATGANKLGRKDLAGKTGTTNEQRDTWFNGFTSSIAATTWLGLDNSKPLGRGETGGKAALPMWIYFMEQALRDEPEKTLIAPPGIIQVYIDPETGLRAYPDSEQGVLEYFRKEHAPTDFSYATPVMNNNGEQPSVEELF